MTMATNAIDQTRRMLSLVTYLRERPGAHVQRRRPRLRDHRGRADLRPRRAAPVRDQLPRRRSARHRHRRRPDLVAQPGRRAPSRCGSPPTRRPRCWSPPAPWPRCRGCARATGRRCCGPPPSWRRRPARRPAASSRLSVTFESEGGVFADVDRAISERRRLWLRYYSPARDELTEREVDPIRLFAVGHTYMEAWCRLSEARRTFRLDRVAEIRLLDEPSAPPGAGAAGSVRGAGAAGGRGSRGRGRGRARWPLGRRVLPARQRRGTARRRTADHVAHPRSGLAAPARAAARPGRADRRRRRSWRESARQAARAALAAYDGPA